MGYVPGTRYHYRLQGNPSNPECFDDNTAVEFIDGLLSPAQVDRVEKHAARCESCRRLLAELGRVASLHGDTNGPTQPRIEMDSSTLATGQQVGRFVIISRLGAGGMGVVFAAYDPKLDRKVALKLLRSHEDVGLAPHHAQMRLLREAQAIAQLSHHENVVTVYDYGTFQNQVYIAMEFVEGETLTHWLKRWDRQWRDVVGKFLQAGNALAAAHVGGLVHRDFKPDNVLVGNDERVRVMDFGLARSLFADPALDSTIEEPVKRAARPPPPSPVRASPAGKAGAHGGRLDSDGHSTKETPRALNHPLTKTGTVLGTPRYMAPEQFSAVVADARSDQFSFCVALYEALYKQHPFKGLTSQGLIDAPDTTKVRAPPSNSNVPAWLHKALLRGLALEPHKRFPAMDALLREIKPRPLPQPIVRRYTPIAVAVLALALAVYLFVAKRYTESDLETAQTLIVKLEKQSLELTEKVRDMTAEVKVLRRELRNPGGMPVEVGRLRDELGKAKTKLADALAELEETEAELAEATGTELVAANDSAKEQDGKSQRKGRQKNGRNGRDGDGRTPRVRPADLESREVSDEIARFRTDFAICFSEWRERAEDVPSLYAVRLLISPDGKPRANVTTKGIEDKVVHECITGLLARLRFREMPGETVVTLGFRQDDQGFSPPEINVVGMKDESAPDVERDVESDEDGPVDEAIESEALPTDAPRKARGGGKKARRSKKRPREDLSVKE